MGGVVVVVVEMWVGVDLFVCLFFVWLVVIFFSSLLDEKRDLLLPT